MIRIRRHADEVDEEDLDITPMIDMTFLLLIFFMVTSVISKKANPDLPKSVAGDTEEVDKQVMLVLDLIVLIQSLYRILAQHIQAYQQ